MEAYKGTSKNRITIAKLFVTQRAICQFLDTRAFVAKRSSGSVFPIDCFNGIFAIIPRIWP